MESPRFRFFMGIAMLITGLIEFFEVTTEELMGFDVKVHHIIIIFGFNQALTSFVHIFEGVETLDEVTIDEQIEQQLEK
ncbi:MAG: hypothetical protein KF896_12635 [Ignavibacteriae bacterium]|nr:hypothetical protein [Ignavibacteriota bacterium]